MKTERKQQLIEASLEVAGDPGALEVSRIVLPYKPRWYQLKTHRELKRFSVLVFHRRAGKTVLAIIELIKWVIECPLPDARCHYVGPTYSQTKRIAWAYLQNFTRHIPGMDFNTSELRAIFPNGAEIHLLGAENYDSHRGIYSDGVVIDEPAMQHPAVFGEVFRPALADRQGRALFIGTPAGHNSFYRRWNDAGRLEGWYRKMLKVNETGALPISEIKLMQAEMTKQQFEQELLCSFEASVTGAFYAEQLRFMDANERITSVPHDPNLGVWTSWDLGLDDQTVITYWQCTRAEYRMIDVDVFRNTGLDNIIRSMKTKPYNFLGHIAPHDIAVRDYSTSKSRLAFAAELGVDFDLAPRVSLQDGIQAVRNGLPKTVIDEVKCLDAIEALRIYRTEYDDRRGVFKANPFHGPESDYCDSIRYFYIADIDHQQHSLFADKMPQRVSSSVF